MTVEEKQKQDELTRKRPLWDIADSRIEIETIAENAAKHIDEAYPKMRTSQVYMAIPRISQVFVVHLLNYLDNLKRSDIEKCKESGVEFSLGDIATFRIEYLSTPNSEGKESTFNPAILVGPELDYNKRDIPYKDALSVEMAEKARGLGARYILAQYYDQMSDLKPICEAAMKELEDTYDIKFTDWSMLLLTTTYFFREIRNFLVENKDAGELGIEINFADLFNVGIEKDGPDDDIEYNIYMTPGQFFKKERAKTDSEEKIGELI